METSEVLYDSNSDHQAVMTDTKKRPFYYLTFNEILTILCTASIPIALGIYTAITSGQQEQQAEQRRQFDLGQATELRQHALYDKFLNDIYMLHKDGYLSQDASPWVFAKAYHRAAHRQWDAERKAEALQFLVEKRLIATNKLPRTRLMTQVDGIIRLNELNFDNIYLISRTDSLNLLDLTYVSFDQVSMVNARSRFVNFGYASFNWARLNDARFDDSSLAYATFDSTELRRTNFGNSNLTETMFINCNLSTAILTPYQIQQALFYNTVLPNGTLINSTTTTTTTRKPTETSTQIMHETLFVLNNTMSPVQIETTPNNSLFLSHYTEVIEDTTNDFKFTIGADAISTTTTRTTSESSIIPEVLTSETVDETRIPTDESETSPTNSI